MKKLILLFLGLAVISCGGSDDDTSIDPIVGTWIVDTENYSYTVVFNVDGSFISESLIFEDQLNTSTGFINSESLTPMPLLVSLTNGNWVNTEYEDYADYQ